MCEALTFDEGNFGSQHAMKLMGGGILVGRDARIPCLSSGNKLNFVLWIREVL